MKKYSGFTLIEMLIVMGIIIILMSAGIAGGRFAIQRANRIQKQNAVDNIEQALWGYYSDNRRFPAGPIAPATLMEGDGTNDYLSIYMDAGQFDGGTDGDFWYFVTDANQEFMVCASMGGDGDEMRMGIYCSGNGLNTVENPDFTDPATYMPGNVYHEEGDGAPVWNAIRNNTESRSNWQADTRSWQ